MGKGSGKTGQVTIGVWGPSTMFHMVPLPEQAQGGDDEEAGDIHLSIPGQGLSTVNGDPASKRGNPHLFNKLAKVLRD